MRRDGEGEGDGDAVKMNGDKRDVSRDQHTLSNRLQSEALCQKLFPAQLNPADTVTYYSSKCTVARKL